jgi:hypothetical protein
MTEADLMVLAGMADEFDLVIMSKDMELSLRRQLRYDSNPSATLHYHMYLLSSLEQSGVTFNASCARTLGATSQSVYIKSYLPPYLIYVLLGLLRNCCRGLSNSSQAARDVVAKGVTVLGVESLWEALGASRETTTGEDSTEDEEDEDEDSDLEDDEDEVDGRVLEL